MPDQRVGLPGWTLVTLIFAGGMAMLLQNVLPDPSNRSLGDLGDGLVLLASLEHWWRALNGVAVGESWREAGFFYPMANPLGLTDSYLGLAVPYCMLRFCAVNPFSAYTATMAVFATIGYWTAFGFCRATGWVNCAAAALAAWIFAFGAVPLFLAGHAQTYSIMLFPSVGLCLLRAWRAGSRAARAGWGLVAGLIYGLILLTAPQTAWFATFVGGLAIVIYLLLARLPKRSVIWQAAPQAGGFLLGALVGLAVTIIVNRPDLSPVRRRSSFEIYFYSPQVSDVLFQPPIEMFWNDLARRMGLLVDQTRPIAEVALGYGPILLLTLLAGCSVIILHWRSAARNHVADATVLACVAAPLLCWLIQLRPFKHSLWYIIVSVLPAGTLIRTPFRIQDACLMFALVALACLFTRLISRRSRFRIALATALFLLLIGEQLSRGLGARSTSDVTDWFARVGAPPAACGSFYVTPGVGPPQQWYVYQSEAMMLAQWIGLPTLNGNSSWYPDGWDMRDTFSPGYQAAVQAWIARNGLKNVCRLDASSAQWTLEAAAPAG